MDPIRWVIAGRFSPAPSGELFRANGGEWVELLGRCGLIRARVPDRIGSAAFREVSLEVKSMRAFSVPSVIESTPELKALRAIADRPPASSVGALAEIERIAGRGRLWNACSAASTGATTTPSTVLDDVLEVARTQRTDAARAVDTFVAASRGVETARPARSDPALEKIRAAISECILATALDVLRSEPVATLEANWRGLRMLLERFRPQAGIRVDVLDVASDGVIAAVRDLPRSDEFDSPDAVFVVDEVGSIDLLRELSEDAEATSTPCIAAVSPAVLGAENTDELVRRTEQGGPIDPAWEELRASEASRWLCATLNDVILHAEQAGGTTQRVVAGSPAWAVATTLAESWSSKGSFAHILGRTGAISAPAVWTPPDRVRTTAIATETFVPIAGQRELARWGVLTLGSERDSDRVVLAAAPMASSASGAYPLPAQLLAGRIVRFAQWVREQLTPAMDDATVRAVFEQAASVFLFPGISPTVATLTAAVSGESAGRTVHIEAAAAPAQALVSLQMELSFQL